MLCRCAPSFLRVGHAELFALRGDREELEVFFWHAARREYPQLLADAQLSLSEAVVAFLKAFVQRQAELVAEWLRVGYVHGNMNSDNCTLGGRTLDYGPFGFMETYNPHYQPFTSDSDGSYAFARQPEAAQANAASLASALLEVLPEAERQDVSDCVHQIVENDFWVSFREAHQDRCRRKLGLRRWDEEASNLWARLLQLMHASEADFTILFRLLATQYLTLEKLGPAFLRGPPCGEFADTWSAWVRDVSARIVVEDLDPDARLAEMRKASPKYIPRNWMLLEAYEAAERRDYAPLRGMLQLLSSPYDEQPQFEEAYFRTTPPWAQSAGGVSFMS